MSRAASKDLSWHHNQNNLFFNDNKRNSDVTFTPFRKKYTALLVLASLTPCGQHVWSEGFVCRFFFFFYVQFDKRISFNKESGKKPTGSAINRCGPVPKKPQPSNVHGTGDWGSWPKILLLSSYHCCVFTERRSSRACVHNAVVRFIIDVFFFTLCLV